MTFHDDQIYYDFMMSWLGVPYIWGGQSRAGVDCSGFVQKILEMKGLDPSGDQTAQTLRDHFEKFGHEVYPPSFGALVFYGKKVTEINHVAICLSDAFMIEAKGLGNFIKTPTPGNCVTISRIHRRDDIQGIFLPHYESYGEHKWPKWLI